MPHRSLTSRYSNSTPVARRSNSTEWDGSSRTQLSLVLDLDSTLIHTFESIDDLHKLNVFQSLTTRSITERLYTLHIHDVITPAGTGEEMVMWGTFRPEWIEFLEFAAIYFKTIIVWSAGEKAYVDAVTSLLFPPEIYTPKIVYSRRDCEQPNNYTIYKPLIKLYKDPRAIRMGINETNTIVIDDRLDTFSKNEGNGILIPAYDPAPTIAGIMGPDSALTSLRNWFKRFEVASAKDVRNLDKSQIFN